MFLQEPEQTQFDLKFHVFGVPVRVHPWFWIISIMLGWSVLRDGDPNGFLYLAIWVGCVFVSILVHELGHIGAGLLFGAQGHIVLYSFGGLAIGSSDLRERWQRIIVMAGGPIAGFLLLALVMPLGLWVDYDRVLGLFLQLFGVLRFGGDPATPKWFIELMWDLMQINLFWGLINLLPIWPLDGGQISRELFQKYAATNAVRKSLILSIVTSLTFAGNALIGLIRKERFIPFLPQGDLFQIIFFAWFAVLSWQLLQQTGPRAGGRYRVEDESYERAPWERDPDWWKR